MRHHADVLVIVVVHGVSPTIQNTLSVRLRLILDHVKLGVLGVLGKVLLNRTLMGDIAERERLKVVLQAELVVNVWCFIFEFFDEPHVTICGEEELAGDLIHVMLANYATSHAFLQLLLDMLVLVIGD